MSDRGSVASFTRGNRIALKLQDVRGYRKIELTSSDRKRRIVFVHRLVLEAFEGPCPDGMECRHADGKRANNRLENLSWGTKSENGLDQVAHGTHYFLTGKPRPWAKIDAKKARTIRRQYATGKFTHAQLAKKHGLSRSAVTMIVNGKRWK